MVNQYITRIWDVVELFSCLTILLLHIHLVRVTKKMNRTNIRNYNRVICTMEWFHQIPCYYFIIFVLVFLFAKFFTELLAISNSSTPVLLYKTKRMLIEWVKSHPNSMLQMVSSFFVYTVFAEIIGISATNVRWPPMPSNVHAKYWPHFFDFMLIHSALWMRFRLWVISMKLTRGKLYFHTSQLGEKVTRWPFSTYIYHNGQVPFWSFAEKSSVMQNMVLEEILW